MRCCWHGRESRFCFVSALGIAIIGHAFLMFRWCVALALRLLLGSVVLFFAVRFFFRFCCGLLTVFGGASLLSWVAFCVCLECSSL